MSKGSGGGGGTGTQEVIQTTSNLPEYARPYFEEMLGRTMYETTRPYEAFPGQRLADLNKLTINFFFKCLSFFVAKLLNCVRISGRIVIGPPFIFKRVLAVQFSLSFLQSLFFFGKK